MYACVVTRETFKIALMIAGVNDCELNLTYIMNAYIQAAISVKLWTILGLDFGSDTGKIVAINRALNALKSAGEAFRNHLASCMNPLGVCHIGPMWFFLNDRLTIVVMHQADSVPQCQHQLESSDLN